MGWSAESPDFSYQESCLAYALYMTIADETEEYFSLDRTSPDIWAMEDHQGASKQPPPFSTTYDIDAILAQAVAPNLPINSYQTYNSETSPYIAGGIYSHVSASQPAQLGRLDAHPGSIFGSVRVLEPCMSCRQYGFDCAVVQNEAAGQRFSCTSCTMFSRPCSFASNQHFYGPSYSSDSVNGSGLEYSRLEHTRMSENTGLTSQPSFLQVLPPLDPSSNYLQLKDDASESSGKSVARFSRETVRILRDWLSTHHSHPYPTEEEKEVLTQRTSLTKVQVTNWLANARRRGQAKTPQMRSPAAQSTAGDAANNEAEQEQMDPMERWESSPPEQEPASVSDITRAMKIRSPVISLKESGPADYPASEAETAQSQASSDAHSSPVSHTSSKSRHSPGSLGSFGRRGRRRRRPVARAVKSPSTLIPRQYQCTFCIETFKTKHDWQRHEKSLHLSLERWVCAYNVSTADLPRKCAFCGSSHADEAHYETHNYTICQERSLEERTFYRKDHLRQHLRLVHDCQFHAPTMDSWKIAAPRIRSRCGFCGLVVDTWAARTDHIADHFKSGKTMANWRGSWGFDEAIKKLVEDGIPPCKLFHPLWRTRPCSHQHADQPRYDSFQKTGRLERGGSSPNQRRRFDTL